MAEAGHVNTVTILTMGSVLKIICLVLCTSRFSQAWIHNLKLQDDDRPRITMTRAFGFLKDGTVAVNVSMFSVNGSSDVNTIEDKTFGFTLERSKSSGFASYIDANSNCALRVAEQDGHTSVLFTFDLINRSVKVDLGNSGLRNLTIVNTPRGQYLYKNGLAHGEGPSVSAKASQDKSKVIPALEVALTAAPTTSRQGQTTDSKVTQIDNKKTGSTNKRSQSGSVEKEDTEGSKNRKVRETGSDKPTSATKDDDDKNKKVKPASSDSMKQGPKVFTLPMTRPVENDAKIYGAYFLVHFKTAQEEGLYNLYFHNCNSKKHHVNLVVQIIQDNNGNYLSADEMPIPAMYFLFSVVFFVLTLVWFLVLRKANEGVYKIHYLMLVVVFFRSLSDLFHGVNMHMIQLSGIHVDAWAILWYIVYLMRGAVMFVTVLLIGAGWVFIKHVFTDREKKLFLIVIPLQILMNVAWVIMEESEEGYSSYNTWHTIFIGVDLLCCFAILFPVIWSIRHLQEASKTDGKAAINLNKLKLFRHFYILVVAYIYFTRIIGILLQITLPFRYGWMKDLFEEIFLLVFFTLTGYKFRPTSDNPYLQVPLDSDEEDIEMDEVVTKSGNTENVVRVNQGKTDKSSSAKQRESSHEYD
ncbi:hypothetical protein BsWGS_23707 [Bradybaena similaris]